MVWVSEFSEVQLFVLGVSPTTTAEVIFGVLTLKITSITNAYLDNQVLARYYVLLLGSLSIPLMGKHNSNHANYLALWATDIYYISSP